jgi:predicted transcriptional regulator
MTFESLLQEYKRTTGASFGDIADLLGVSRLAINGWRTGRVVPTRYNMIKLRLVFGESVNQCFPKAADK